MQISHAPPDYDCPFCRIVAGEGSERTLPEHVVRRYERMTVFMNPRWWENNRGNVLVVPNEHYENLYELPTDYGTPMLEAQRDAAVAMKLAFECDGVSTRQHNEPAGNQEVWHYHLHVFPRGKDDHLYGAKSFWAPAEELMELTERLRDCWPD